MAFVPQNDLERALMRAPTDASARPEFYRQLLLSNLIVIGRVEGQEKPKSGTFDASGQTVRLTPMQHNGRQAIAVFSSLQRLRAFAKKEEPYLSLNGRALFQMTKGTLLVLNPGSDFGKELLPEEITDLIDPTPHIVTVDKPTNVLIGQPAIYPFEFVNALKVAFAARPEVLMASLVQVAFPDANQPPHPLIGVESSGAWGDIAKEIGRVAVATMAGVQVDAIPIDRKNLTTLTDALLKTPPFYQR